MGYNWEDGSRKFVGFVCSMNFTSLSQVSVSESFVSMIVIHMWVQVFPVDTFVVKAISTLVASCTMLTAFIIFWTL